MFFVLSKDKATLTQKVAVFKRLFYGIYQKQDLLWLPEIQIARGLARLDLFRAHAKTVLLLAPQAFYWIHQRSFDALITHG